MSYTDIVYASLRGVSIHECSNEELFEMVDAYTCQKGILVDLEKLRIAVRLIRCGAA